MAVIEIQEGVYAIVCTRGSRGMGFCDFCRNPSGLLCDYPIGDDGETCDKKICAKCTTRVRVGIDYCPDHKNCEVVN